MVFLIVKRIYKYIYKYIWISIYGIQKVTKYRVEEQKNDLILFYSLPSYWLYPLHIFWRGYDLQS